MGLNVLAKDQYAVEQGRVPEFVVYVPWVVAKVGADNVAKG